MRHGLNFVICTLAERCQVICEFVVICRKECCNGSLIGSWLWLGEWEENPFGLKFVVSKGLRKVV